MARGKKPPNILCETDIDILDYIELLEAHAGGAEVSASSPFASITPIQIARLAEAAVYQNRPILVGKVSEFENIAAKLMEDCIAEQCFLAGNRWQLEMLQSVSADEKIDALKCLNATLEQASRNASARCANILQSIKGYRDRKGTKGRTRRENMQLDDVSYLLDLQIISDAINSIHHEKRFEINEIKKAIPNVIATYLRLGQLRWLGEDTRRCIEAHTKRLHHRLEDILTNRKDYRSFSILGRVTAE